MGGSEQNGHMKNLKALMVRGAQIDYALNLFRNVFYTGFQAKMVLN